MTNTPDLSRSILIVGASVLALALAACEQKAEQAAAPAATTTAAAPASPAVPTPLGEGDDEHAARIEACKGDAGCIEAARARGHREGMEMERDAHARGMEMGAEAHRDGMKMGGVKDDDAMPMAKPKVDPPMKDHM